MRSLPAMRRVALALAHCSLLSVGCGDPDRQYLSIATAGTGGIYYPLGGALANLLSAADSSRRYTAEVTGGSVENINRLRTGGVDVAMAIATTVYEAFTGGADYAAPFSELRIVAPLYPNLTHVLVRSGSRLRSVADFRGARVSIGAAGSGTEQVARHVLEAHNVSPSDVQLRYLSFSESAAALRDGAIDAAIISVGYPASAVLEATAAGSARLLSIGPEATRALTERFGYYAAARIPAGAYRGVDVDVPTVAVLNWIVATEDLDGTVVTLILDVLRDRREALVRVHEIARQIDLAALTAAPIPLHSSAAAWLGEHAH